eukprot:UN08910
MNHRACQSVACVSIGVISKVYKDINDTQLIKILTLYVIDCLTAVEEDKTWPFRLHQDHCAAVSIMKLSKYWGRHLLPYLNGCWKQYDKFTT